LLAIVNENHYHLHLQELVETFSPRSAGIF